LANLSAKKLRIAGKLYRKTPQGQEVFFLLFSFKFSSKQKKVNLTFDILHLREKSYRIVEDADRLFVIGTTLATYSAFRYVRSHVIISAMFYF